MKINKLNRQCEIVNVLNKLEESKSCLLFYGSSGVGKTTFLQQLNDNLKNSSNFSLYISFHKSDKEILRELLDFAKKILSVEIIAKRIIKDLSENKHQYIRHFTIALLNDITKLTSPVSSIIMKLDTFKVLTKQIEKISLSAIENQIETLEYDLFPILLSTIQEYSNYLDKKTYIIYDQVENNPTKYLKQIKESLSNSGNNLCQILSIQEELLQSNVDLYNFIAGIKRLATDYTLSGFTKQEIKDWFCANNLTYNYSDIDNLIEITDKPIYLEECIYANKIDLNSIKQIVELKDGGYFASNFKEFSLPQQKLIIALCFQPQNYILTDSILMTLTKLSAPEFDNFMQRLENTMLVSVDKENDLHSIDLHFHKVDYLFSKNKNTVREIANELKALIDSHSFTTIEERKHFFSIILNLNESEIRFIFKYFVKFNVEEDGISIDWIKKIKKNEKYLTITERMKLNTEYAKSCYLLGKYKDGIENTKLDIKEVINDINLLDYCFYKLYRGRNYFRESKYNEAIKDLHFSAQIFKEIEKWDEYVECVKTIATIYRDKGNYEKAYVNSKELYDALKDIPLRSTSASYVCRNYIRSTIMASKKDDLKEPLKKAFDVVENSLNINDRDLANCYFTEGEYYRYKKNFDKSIVSYEKAMQFSRKVNNPDTEIYALLGKCDSLIHLNKYQELYENIKLLSEVLDLYNYEKSTLKKSALEILHLNLFINILFILKERRDISIDISFSNIFIRNDLLCEYDKRGIIWVRRFWDLFVRENKSNNIMKF